MAIRQVHCITINWFKLVIGMRMRTILISTVINLDKKHADKEGISYRHVSVITWWIYFFRRWRGTPLCLALSLPSLLLQYSDGRQTVHLCCNPPGHPLTSSRCYRTAICWSGNSLCWSRSCIFCFRRKNKGKPHLSAVEQEQQLHTTRTCLVNIGNAIEATQT